MSSSSPVPRPVRRVTGPDGPTPVFAHRGDSTRHPENTLAAFRAAIELGAEGIELDVAITADGVPVVIHDRSVGRTTDGVGEVDELTAATIRTFDAGDGERIPVLREVLELAAGRIEVNIEIKAADAAEHVAAAVAGLPDLRWFASSFQWDALVELGRLLPASRLYPLSTGAATIEDVEASMRSEGAVYTPEQFAHELARFSTLRMGVEDSIEFAQGIGAEGLSIWDANLGAGDVDQIHAAGLRAWVWTTNDPSRATELMRIGVDGICTDVPATILAARDLLR